MAEQSASAPAADFVPLASGIYLEGLAVDHDRGTIWFSDVIAGGIHGVKQDGTPVAVLDAGRMWTGGIMMNADGSVLSSGQGGIRWNHPETGASGWLIDRIDGEPVNGINEMWPDGEGGIFFGTIDLDHIIAARPGRPVALYRLTRTREVIRIADGLCFTNAMAFDPDRGLFHCCETFGKAWTWDVGPDLSLSGKRVLLDRDDCDGMALDTGGNVWITGVYSPGVLHRVRPDGTQLPPVPTPPGATTQVRFGGPDGRDVYITLVPEDAGDCLKNGRPLTGQSTLYAFRSEVAGVKIGPAQFDLA